MSNNIQVFDNNDFGKVRAFLDESGEPAFVAKDVCEILDLGNPRSSLALLDEDEKGVHSVDTPGGAQNMTTVTEPGFYKLVMRSRKPEAKAFQRWVTHEVLPALRKTGAYKAQPAETLEELSLRAITGLTAEVERQKSVIKELEPKARFADAVAASDGTCLVGELAKMLTQAGVPIGQNRLFERLRDDGFLGKSGQNRNVPLQRYVEQGLFRIKESAIVHSDGHVSINRTTKVTGKGQAYFMRYFGATGALPVD